MTNRQIITLLVLTAAISLTAFISLTLCGILAAAVGALVLVVELVRYVRSHARRLADDCGYSTTPFGPAASAPWVTAADRPSPVASEIVLTPARAFAVIKGGKRPTSSGAPE